VGDPSYGLNVTTGTPFWINITDDCNLSYARVTYQYDTGCDGSDGTELIGVFYDTDDDNVISLQVNFTEECCHRWRVRAYDEFGRDSGWILSPWYRVDDTPPVTTKKIGLPRRMGGLFVTTGTPIWLNTTDETVPCAVGCEYLHYEVWWDSDGDRVVDTVVESGNASSNNVTLYFTETCYHEIWWYGVDYLGNTENITKQQHYVDDAAPEITIEVGDPSYGLNVTTGTPFWINITDDCNLSYARVTYQYDTNCDGIFATEHVGDFYDTDDDDVISLQVNFTEDCCHRWRVIAYDEWGRESQWFLSPWYHVDDTPPVTTKEIGNPQSSGGLYVTTSTPIWLNTTDQGPYCAVGCDYLHYEVWWDSDGDGTVDMLMESGNASSNNVTLYFTETCYHEIWWYGVDFFGNTETMHVQGHYVDETPPVTAHEFGVPYYTDGIDEWITTSTLIYLNATDKGPCQVGDYAISFRVWDMVSGWGPWVPGPPSTNMTLTVGEEGQHYIEFFAVDYLGNTAPLRNISFYVDDTPPTTTKEYGSPFYAGATVSWPDGGDVNHYITSDTLIHLNATDNCLDVNRTEYFIYRWDGSAFVVVQPWTIYTGPFSFASIGDTNECLHRIWIRSYDTLGNLETQWSQHVMVDNTPPETTKEIGSPRRSGGLYVTTDTPIWLNTTDIGTTRCKVGCNYTHYEIWWDSDGDHVVDMLMESGNASSNNVTIYFTETCYHEIWWYGVDYLGNTENITKQQHYVDDAAPEITIQVGHPRYNNGGYVYVTTDTPFWINISDDCNLSYARIWYQYDTNCDGIYANEHRGYFYDTDDDDVISLQLNFPQNGCHRWRAQAFDMYGRETGNWYSDWYRVIDTQPKINIMGTPNQVGHEGIPVTFTAGAVTANITFNATITINITGPKLYDNLTYYWDWNNDGIYDEGPFGTNTADHTWPDDYTENVNVQVRYKYGGMDNDTCIITILNKPPTAPTDIIIDPPFFSLGDLLEATAIGSTDVPADIPLTYYYLFYDATTDLLIQDWSTVNSIVITSSLENHIILIKSRAHDKDSGISGITQVTATSDSDGITPTISINPVSSTVIQGNDFCIEIHVDSAGHSLLTAGFQLTYPTIFTVKSFTYENLLGTSIIELGTPSVGDTSGLINYAVSRTDGGTVPENGTLVTICFTAPASPGGPYTLDLHDVILVDGTGNTISGIVVTDGTVTVNPPSQCLCYKGDFDKDCYIGPLDLTYFAGAWGKIEGEAGYSDCFDFNNDGIINALDLGHFASHWGETYCDCAPCNAPPWQQWP